MHVQHQLACVCTVYSVESRARRKPIKRFLRLLFFLFPDSGTCYYYSLLLIMLLILSSPRRRQSARLSHPPSTCFNNSNLTCKIRATSIMLQRIITTAVCICYLLCVRLIDWFSHIISHIISSQHSFREWPVVTQKVSAEPHVGHICIHATQWILVVTAAVIQYHHNRIL